MFQRVIRASILCAAGSAAMAACVAVSAQDAAHADPVGKTQNAEALHTDLVKTGLYLITGGGGNSLLRFSANGMLLVDAKSPGNYRALMSQVRNVSKLSDMSVRALVLTDQHPDHAGNEAQFAAAGVQIVAQANAIRHLPAIAAVDGKPAPVAFSYDRDYTLRMGGVEVRLAHFGRAHTDGDSVVYFPDLKVVALGDLFTPDTPDTPEPDFSAGGSLVGWPPVLAQILMLDFDVAVPGTGPLVTRADVEAFKSKIDLVVARATALVRQGVAKDQLMAQLKTDDIGWKFDFSGDALDRFYAELSQGTIGETSPTALSTARY